MPVALRVTHRIPGPVHVLEAVRERRRSWARGPSWRSPRPLEVAVAGDREAGLDDVDTEARELLRDLELLAHVQRDAGRLLAVAQGGIEDLHVISHGSSLPGGVFTRPRVFRQTKTPSAERHEEASATPEGARSYIRRRLWVRSSFVMNQQSCQMEPPFVKHHGGRWLTYRATIVPCVRRYDDFWGSASSRACRTRTGRSSPRRARPARPAGSRTLPVPTPTRRRRHVPVDRAGRFGGLPGPPSGEGQVGEWDLPRARRCQLRPHGRRPLLPHARDRRGRRPPPVEALVPGAARIDVGSSGDRSTYAGTVEWRVVVGASTSVQWEVKGQFAELPLAPPVTRCFHRTCVR